MSGAIAGLAISTAVSGISFYQANQQKKLSQQAELDAAEAMEAARGKLDVNFAEQMSINKESYDNQRQAMLSQGAMATNAGIESERGSAATAGRVYAGQLEEQRKIRNDEGDEMTNIKAAILEEDSRLRDLNVSLDLEEVAGNQMKASDAQQAAAAANQQGLQSGAAALQSGLELVPLYMKNSALKQESIGNMTMTDEQKAQFGNIGSTNRKDEFKINSIMGDGDGITNMDFIKYSKLSPKERRRVDRDLSKDQADFLKYNQFQQ
jgi:hypothetical protein